MLLEGFENHGEQDDGDAQQSQVRGNEDGVAGVVQGPSDVGDAGDTNRGPYDASDSFFQNGGSFRFWRV